MKLRESGREGYEAVALWAGRINDAEFEIATTIFPEQESYKTEYGLMFRVPTDALKWVYKKLQEHNMILCAQIHTHPTDAYHSEADDDLSIVTKLGGLSIVVPYFAKEDPNINNWAVYRYLPESGWTYLSQEIVSKLIEIQ